jgi:hypothetical protein
MRSSSVRRTASKLAAIDRRSVLPVTALAPSVSEPVHFARGASGGLICARFASSSAPTGGPSP